MPQQMPEFQRLQEWEKIAKRLVDKYPERFGHVEYNRVICYLITNKEKTDNARPYEMQTDKLPMRLSNQYDYFVWFKHSEDWHDKPENIKVALVLSALDRIDSENPYTLRSLDYRDQTTMVRTFGIDWFMNPDIPDALKMDIEFKV